MSDGVIDAYQPLMAAWLMEMTLFFGWHKPRGRLSKSVFEDEEYLEAVGLDMHVDDERGTFIVNGRTCTDTQATRVKILKNHLNHMRKQPVRDSAGLFANMALVGKLLSLSPAEMAVLGFAAVITSFHAFKSIVSFHTHPVSTRQFCQMLAHLTGQETTELQASLRDDAPLVTAGVVTVDASLCDVDSKVSLLDGFSTLLLQSDLDERTLSSHFLTRAGPPTLDERNFEHLSQDISLLKSYLQPALMSGERGVNILFYGLPGTGKTEFAKSLATALNAELYEISYADQEGNPVKGEARLRAYNFCQRILTKRKNVILMFDEIEDVFPQSASLLTLFGLGEGAKSGVSGKAWVNRTLERNTTPSIWLTNDPDIDPAYLRRFDYSVRFPVPPQPVRAAIANHHLGQFNPAPAWLARIASNEQMTPAQYERAAKVARTASEGDNQKALAVAGQTLRRSAMLLGQTAMPTRNAIVTGYDLRFVNTSMDLEEVVHAMQNRPRGTFCLYGPAGTGKSEFARHLADRIGVSAVLRRASDILSPWVGQSERNIAAMFAEAREQQAVLVLDEADSFLADRRDALRSWEVTQVNELLTQMEAFEGIFICTTNLIERLDQASLRRFAFKIHFDYLNSTQRWEMFLQELARLGGDLHSAHDWKEQVRALDKLTPGDFAVVANRFAILGAMPNPFELFRQLQEECRLKQGESRAIGFMSG